jgi:hypothetical protein
VGLACARCGSLPKREPPVVLQGERVTIRSALTISLCGGVATQLDLFVSGVESELGLARSPEPLTIIVIPADQVASACGRFDKIRAGGCFLPAEAGGPAVTVGATNFLGLVFHEVVHGIVDRSPIGSPPPFVGEGLAGAFGSVLCDQTWERYPTTLEQLLAINDSPSEVSSEFYDLTGRFIRYLILQYGTERLVSWGSKLNPNSKSIELLTTFQATYGKAMSQVWDEKVFEPWAGSPMCQWPEATSVGPFWELSLGVSCSDSTVEAVTPTDGSILTSQVVLPIAATGTFEIGKLVGLGDVRGISALKIMPCGSCDLFSAGEITHEKQRVALAAGRYLVRRTADRSETAVLNATLEPWPECNGFADDCPADQKCVNTSDDEITCAPLATDPVPEGKPCALPEQSLSLDPCGKGWKCDRGACRPLCQGPVAAQTCPDGFACVSGHPAGYPYPGICLGQCDPWNIDSCPVGERCGQAQKIDVCLPYSVGPFSLGESCAAGSGTFRDPNEEFVDPCQTGLGCLPFANSCIPMCQGTPDVPTCPEGAECVRGEDNTRPGFCLRRCNPFASVCSSGEQCISDVFGFSGRFYCFPVGAVTPDQYGKSGCGIGSVCAQGLYCSTDAQAAPGCDPAAWGGCCTAVCDPTGADGGSPCPDADKNQRCVALGDGLGYCTLAGP